MFMVLNNTEFENYKNKVGTVLVDPNYVSREDYDKMRELDVNDDDDTSSNCSCEVDEYGRDMLKFYSQQDVPITNESTKLAFVDLIGPSLKTYSYCHTISREFVINKIIDFKDWEMWNDEKFCFQVVSEKPIALQYVKCQTEEMCINALKHDYINTVFKFIENKTEKIVELNERINKNIQAFICTEAIKQDGNALCFVKNIYDD